MQPEIFRILDANLNRSQEGLRVCEEVARFMLNSPTLTKELKDVRHGIAAIVKGMGPLRAKALRARDSKRDVGRSDVVLGEMPRSDARDVFLANIQRVKESMRALEEFFKLTDKKSSTRVCALRFKVYDIEKKAFKKIEALRNIR